MNIFMVRDSVLITPPVTQDILEGITRRSILQIAADLGVRTEEREIDRSELLIAEEVFLSGTAARIAPITKIEQYHLASTHPITDKLLRALQEIVNQESSSHVDWIQSFKSNPT